MKAKRMAREWEKDDAWIAKLEKKLRVAKKENASAQRLSREFRADGWECDFLSLFATGNQGTPSAPQLAASSLQSIALAPQHEGINDEYRSIEGEDIYGRRAPSKWLPRRLLELAPTEQVKRKVRGILNRTSDATLATCAKEVISWYAAHPAAEVNQALVDEVYEVCVARAKRSDDALLPTYAALIIAIHIGARRDLGFMMLERLAEPITERSAVFVARFCELGLVGGCLAISLADSPQIDSDIAVRVLDIAYERVKADEAERLRAISESLVAKKCATSRDRHAAKTLAEMHKAKRGATAKAQKERTQKLRATIRRNFGPIQPVRVEWQDIQQNRGRWWRVGAAWLGREHVLLQSNKQPQDHFMLETLAKQQRMNTPARRTVFVTIMAAKDPQAACHLCADRDERDVAAVSLRCSEHEHPYNAFYAEFLRLWIKEKSKPRSFAVKLAAWDALKALDSPRKAFNLAKLCSSVLVRPALVGLADLFKPIQPQAALTDTNTQCFATVVVRDLLVDPPETFSECLRLASPKDDDQDAVAAGLLAFISSKLTPPRHLASDAEFNQRKQMLYHAILDPSPYRAARKDERASRTSTANDQRRAPGGYEDDN